MSDITQHPSNQATDILSVLLPWFEQVEKRFKPLNGDQAPYEIAGIDDTEIKGDGNKGDTKHRKISFIPVTPDTVFQLNTPDGLEDIILPVSVLIEEHQKNVIIWQYAQEHDSNGHALAAQDRFVFFASRILNFLEKVNLLPGEDDIINNNPQEKTSIDVFDEISVDPEDPNRINLNLHDLNDPKKSEAFAIIKYVVGDAMPALKKDPIEKGEIPKLHQENQDLYADTLEELDVVPESLLATDPEGIDPTAENMLELLTFHADFVSGSSPQYQHQAEGPGDPAPQPGG